MRMKRLGLGVLLAVLALLFPGCMSLEKPEPAREDFTFNPLLPRQPPAPTGPTLAVAYFACEPQFASGEFVYRISDLQWESDFYRQFVDSPATLVTELTRSWLAGSGRFREVGTPGLLKDSSARLQGRIVELYGDFRTAEARGVIGLEFSLWRRGAQGDAWLWSKNFRRSVGLPERTPGGLVRAWDQGLAEILAELTTEVSRSLAP